MSLGPFNGEHDMSKQWCQRLTMNNALAKQKRKTILLQLPVASCIGTLGLLCIRLMDYFPTLMIWHLNPRSKFHKCPTRGSAEALTWKNITQKISIILSREGRSCFLSLHIYSPQNTILTLENCRFSLCPSRHSNVHDDVTSNSSFPRG